MAFITISEEFVKHYKLKFVNDKVSKNILITEDGIYDVVYMKNSKIINNTGKIINIKIDSMVPKSEYILLDYSDDNSNKRERIYLYQIIDINDVTPKNAYIIAVEHGFKGSIEEWLDLMRGRSAYEIAVKHGFEGSEEDWLASHGDTSFINKQLTEIKNSLTWKTSM